jgi:hypothetical protein
MKKTLLLIAVGFGLTALAPTASAQQPNPFNVPTVGPIKKLFKKSPLPAFQASPWYMYFPYNAHFQTPAPMLGESGAGGFGGFGSPNPYFPAHGHGK